MTVSVFFPSLMGVGIIVSGALLMSDWLRRLLPQGNIRRKHNVVVGTYGAISDAVDAAGYRITEPWFIHRTLRSRTTYLGTAVALWAGGAILITIGNRLFDDPLGLFYESPWATGLGYGFGVALIVFGFLCLTFAVVYRSLPKSAMRLINETALGRIVVPSEADHQEAFHNIERKA